MRGMLSPSTLEKLLSFPPRERPQRPAAPKVKDKELRYLITLNNKLTEMRWMERPRPNMVDLRVGDPPYIPVLDYRNYKMAPEEYTRMLSIIQDKELPVEPINAAMGFQVGYNIYVPIDTHITGSTIRHENVLCTFVERQLQEKNDWKKIWKIVEGKRNKELSEFYGLPLIRDHSSYDY